MSQLESTLARLPRKRNRYFDGKFMAAGDFATDPDYLLARHRLHLRLAHGWGILHGLEVEPHPDPACRQRFVVLRPGLAIDPEGRELVVVEPRAVEVITEGAPKPQQMVLFLRYGEEEVELTPTLYAEDGTVPEPDQPGRVLETATVELVPFTHLDAGEWPAQGGGPFAPREARVALALVKPAEKLEIDPFGPRQIGPPTNIESVSWPHGQTLEVTPALELTFSAPLAPQSGLDTQTFVVETGAAQQPRRPVVGSVTLSEDRRGASFVPEDPHPLGESLFITLKCDFILDHNGRPIDGSHWGGHLPTGSGNPGGTFESWFHLAPPSPCDGDSKSSKPDPEETR